MDKGDIRTQVAELLKCVSDPEASDVGLQELLQALGNPENAADVARFIPGMGESYGVPLPALHAIAAELARWGTRHPGEIFALVERLWNGGTREGRIIAAKVLERLGKRQPERTLALAASFVGGFRNWEECDQLACFGLRYALQRRPELVLPRCEEWVKSGDKWTRRFGVVVLTSLPKDKAYVPSEREFSILDAVMADEAREVQDAVAWALREMAKRHPKPVTAFLRRHAAAQARSTRRIVRQAAKALPQEIRATLAAG